MWRSSEGNPCVVVEAMRVVTQEELSPGQEALFLPERLRDIIGRQLDRLERGSRELVALASVVGRGFEFSLLQHVSGLGDEDGRGRVGATTEAAQDMARRLAREEGLLVGVSAGAALVGALRVAEETSGAPPWSSSRTAASATSPTASGTTRADAGAPLEAALDRFP